MIAEINKSGRYKCHCCHYYTFRQAPAGDYDICPVCIWEDDPFQLANPAEAGGANRFSLMQARTNFANYGVSDLELKHYAKRPNAEELPD